MERTTCLVCPIRTVSGCSKKAKNMALLAGTPQNLSNLDSLKISIGRNTKGGSITVLLTSCLTGLDKSALQIKTKIVSCHTAACCQTGGQPYSDTSPFSVP